MTQPTIDEMLDWLDQWEGDNGRVAAIRAILEQHKELPTGTIADARKFLKRSNLDAIRAFVERVDALPMVQLGVKDKWEAAEEELAAMEADNAGTND